MQEEIISPTKHTDIVQEMSNSSSNDELSEDKEATMHWNPNKSFIPRDTSCITAVLTEDEQKC